MTCRQIVDSVGLFQLATDFSECSGYWGSALPFIFGVAVGGRARQMLEIGVWRGGTTRALLHAAAVNMGHLTSIDIDDCEGAVTTALRDRWTGPRSGPDDQHHSVFGLIVLAHSARRIRRNGCHEKPATVLGILASHKEEVTA